MTESRPSYSIYPQPEPQTALDAALERLREGKQLEPRHRAALVEFIIQGADVIELLQGKVDLLEKMIHRQHQELGEVYGYDE